MTRTLALPAAARTHGRSAPALAPRADPRADPRAGTGDPGPLFGRAAEIEQLDRLLCVARSGRSGVLTIVGEAGIGKTALLEHAADTADGFRFLRCTGIESEAELPYAALHLLLGPVLDRLEALPGPQADALRGALGLADASGTDRFLVGLATLSLLAETAGERPLLCLLDDAHWLDRESAEALLFAARRLCAEGVAIIGATRNPNPPCVVREHATGPLCLTGLDDAAAGALLSAHGADLPAECRERLIGEAVGNPLALIELAAAMRGEKGWQHAGAVVLSPMPGDSPVQDAFGRQVDRLPARTGRLLLVAAADGTGDVDVISAAAQRLGVTFADLRPAEDAELVRLVGPTLSFRHPLIRSAVYTRSGATDRIAAHRALADVLDPRLHADRRAWHLAAATIGPDAAVADELEAAAARARLRGGRAASAAAHERAAQLTSDPALRGRRLAAAAENARDAGQLPRATALAEQAAALTDDRATLARLAVVRARVEFEHGTARRAADLLVQGATLISDSDPERAGALLVEAVRMAYFACGAPSIGRAIKVIDSLALPSTHPLHPVLTASAVLARLLDGSPADAVAPLHEPVSSIRLDALGTSPTGTHNHATALLLLIGDTEQALDASDKMVRVARERGLIGGLPHTLVLRAEGALAVGRLREALAAGMEGLRIAEDTGQQHSATNLRSIVARVAAMTGDDRRCTELAEQSMAYAAAHDTGASYVMAALALCTLDLSRGRYAAAFDRLADLDADLLRHPIFSFLAPPEQIEAAARSGRPERAHEALRRYETWISRHRSRPTASAIAARCRALLAPDDEADQYFQEAMRLHWHSPQPLARARTALLYGEWLRRSHRTADAGTQLRLALQTFENCGAMSWADRARAELRATGQTVTSSEDQSELLAALTPQELQVAGLAASGLSNRDIGAQLFLSPRTVGYHLYKVYRKLGISGRRDLARSRLQ